MMDKRLPQYLRRIDDGALFILGDDDRYRMTSSMMYAPHSYTYEQIMGTGKFEEVK
jgi:hypothetical protein